jgi:hypothetical protein
VADGTTGCLDWVERRDPDWSPARGRQQFPVPDPALDFGAELASTILSRVVRHVATDWATTYGITPLLLETVVDPRGFDGASHRAANWIVVGTTTGRGRNDRHRRVVRAPKRVNSREERPPAHTPCQPAPRPPAGTTRDRIV